MSETFDELLHLARAGANVLHLASHEWERVRGLCIGLARELDLQLRVWSSSSGRQVLGEDGHFETEDARQTDPIDVLRGVAEGPLPELLLLEDVHPFLEHHAVVRWVRELARLPSEPRRLAVLSTALPDLPVDLRKEVPTVDLPLPGLDDLRTVCRSVAGDLGVEVAAEDSALVEAARGLTVMEARLAFGQAAARLGRLDHRAVALVAREKKRVIRQGRVLEYYEPDARMQDVGGLDALKTWLDRRGRAFGPGARDFGLESPRGALLLGVQGCGKSLVAKAISAAWDFPLLRFDLGKVFGGVVGQSEANIRAALQVAQALAPCVLWIDEIEKGLAGLGSSDRTDGGTTARVVGTFLTWMQEKREPVFVVATANRIDLLPPELLRKGRFDELFFVDLPARAVREEILAIHLRKRGRSPEDFDLGRLSELSVGYSGAELEEAVREGLYDAFADGRELTTDHVARALEATHCLSLTMREQIHDLRDWASARARPATTGQPELVPPEKRKVPRLRQESANPFIPAGA